jgi:hypothetical protein
MFEWPWVKARKRREAKQTEADRVGKLLRDEKERRAAQILADQIHRSRIAALHRSQPAPARPASVTPIKATGYGLTAQRAAQEDQRKRDEEDARKRHQSSDSTAYVDQTQMAFTSSMPETSNEVSHKLSGGGGTFDGGGASGDWSSGSSSSDSGSSSSDSSSSSSDSGSSSGSSD